MSNMLNQQPSGAKVAFPSDNLRSIYGLCEKHPIFVELFGMRPQIRLVIDTNIVLAELLFVTSKRRNESARTVLREVLDSGVVITIAPTKMHEEVNKHLPRLARQRSIPEGQLRQAWLEFQARIEFRDVKDRAFPEQNVRDPNDVPFVDLYLTSDADAVLTQDKDIPAMGAKGLGPEILLPMRDYARTKSPEVGLRIGGVVVVGIPIVSLVVLLKLLATALRTLRNLPAEVQLLLLGGVVVAALHPRTREALSAGFSSLAAGLKSSAGVFGEVFGELSVKICTAQLELKAKEAVIEGVIPRRSLAPSAFLTELINEEGKKKADFDPVHPLRITEKRATVRARRKGARRISVSLKAAARRTQENEQESPILSALCLEGST